MATPRIHQISNITDITKYLRAIDPQQVIQVADDHAMVILWRHFPHKKNQTIRKFLRLAQALGRVLAKNLKIDTVFASPEPRAQQHLMAFMAGLGKMSQLRTADELCALNSEGPDAISKVLAESEEAGMGPEAFILADDSYYDMRVRRGDEGAQFVLDTVAENLGKVVLMGSHGGSRLEPTIAALTNRPQKDYEHVMNTGCMCILMVDNNGDVVSEDYLEIDPALAG